MWGQSPREVSGLGVGEGIEQSGLMPEAWDELQPVWIHHSRNMGAIASARKETIRTGRMDHTFHYASDRQSELWLDVHRAHSPAVNDSGVIDIYRRLFNKIAAQQNSAPVHVIGLGCGGGAKDRLLLETLKKAGSRIRFTPIDVSPALALLSASVSREWCDEPLHPIVADLRQFPKLPKALDPIDDGAARLYTFFGMIPNFEPDEILPALRGWIRPQDRLVLSANLAPALTESAADYRAAMEIVRPQYDNPQTRNWLTRVLHDWGLESLEPAYSLRIEGKNGLLRFCANAGTMQLFFSYRYTPERLHATLAAHGLALGDGFVSPSREEGVWIAAPQRN